MQFRLGHYALDAYCVADTAGRMPTQNSKGRRQLPDVEGIAGGASLKLPPQPLGMDIAERCELGTSALSTVPHLRGEGASKGETPATATATAASCSRIVCARRKGRCVRAIYVAVGFAFLVLWTPLYAGSAEASQEVSSSSPTSPMYPFTPFP